MIKAIVKKVNTNSCDRKFDLTYGTGSYCSGGLHLVFTSCSGLRSVVWTLSVIKNCRGNDVEAFAKLSHVCKLTRTLRSMRVRQL